MFFQQLHIFFLYRVSLDETDYQECKEDTMAQLREFNDRLQRMISGDMTLVNELGAIQLVHIGIYMYLFAYLYIYFIENVLLVNRQLKLLSVQPSKHQL